MRAVRYVLLDPTGNRTAMVLDPTAEEEREEITRRLMAESEQVAYCVRPADPAARGAIRLMGGEFCGNAAMAAACWWAREDGLAEGAETVVPMEVSGAEGVLPCRVRHGKDGWEGTVTMPPVLGTEELRAEGYRMTAVRMQGIRHWVLDGSMMEDREAESFLQRRAAGIPEEAAGLMQWNRRSGVMRPLVLVKGSGTMVWETGCGSGSAAVGAYEALRRGEGTTETRVHQEGGTIVVNATVRGGRVTEVTITGKVIMGEEQLYEQV